AYEMLSGAVPFPEDESPLVTLLRHANEPVPPLREIDPSVPRPLSDWVARMLAKEPGDRPPGAAKAWDGLDDAVVGVLGSRWRRDALLAGDPESLPERRTRPTIATGPNGTEQVTGVVRRRRFGRRHVVGAVAVVAIIAAGVAALVIGTRGPGTPAGAGAQRPVADFLPRPSERLSLVVAGPTLVLADPRGRVVQVDSSSLEVQRVLQDPAGPRAVTVSGGRVYVADGEGVTARRAAKLAPVSVLPLRDATAFAVGGPLVVASRGGRVCELTRGPPVCGRVGFAPTGVGASASGAVVFAAEGARGGIAILHRRGDRLIAADRPIPVARPHGELVFFRGRLYVPGQRAIAIVDP